MDDKLKAKFATFVKAEATYLKSLPKEAELKSALAELKKLQAKVKAIAKEADGLED